MTQASYSIIYEQQNLIDDMRRDYMKIFEERPLDEPLRSEIKLRYSVFLSNYLDASSAFVNAKRAEESAVMAILAFSEKHPGKLSFGQGNITITELSLNDEFRELHNRRVKAQQLQGSRYESLTSMNDPTLPLFSCIFESTEPSAARMMEACLKN